MNDGELILVAGALLAGGLLASLLAGRLRVPSLALFLGVGMLIGSDGAGWIEFDDYEQARTIGTIALALILFEGGITSGTAEVRPVLRTALSLAFFGTITTAVVSGLVATALFDFSTLEGMLLGSIIAATDGAAIFALLRTSTLRRRLARTLEAESGLNDAVAVLLVLGFIDWIQIPDYGVPDMAWLFARELAVGVVVGGLVGLGAVRVLRRLQLATVGLYPVASLAVAALAFGAAETLEGSGFIAAYLAGLALGAAPIPAKQTIVAFHQGLAWLSQVVMFLALGLLVFPGQLGDVALEGTILALAVAFVARPAGVLVATALGPFSAAERALLGWAGLRGALPVVLATFPVLAGTPHSLEFFNIIFFAVLFSTVLQGSTFEGLARRLGVTTATPALPRPLTDPATIRRLGAEVVEHAIEHGDAAVGVPVRDLDLPRDAVVNVIIRGDEAIPPRGSTPLRAGDRVQILVRHETLDDLSGLSDRWRGGPLGPRPRPRSIASGYPPVFAVRPWNAADGDARLPAEVEGVPIVERLRERRDRPGSLLLLADGRYAVTGPQLALGSRQAVTDWVRRRLERADPEEQAWLQGVIGTLAADTGLPPLDESG